MNFFQRHLGELSPQYSRDQRFDKLSDRQICYICSLELGDCNGNSLESGYHTGEENPDDRRWFPDYINDNSQTWRLLEALWSKFELWNAKDVYDISGELGIKAGDVILIIQRETPRGEGLSRAVAIAFAKAALRETNNGGIR